jgi:hypothetical protein
MLHVQCGTDLGYTAEPDLASKVQNDTGLSICVNQELSLRLLAYIECRTLSSDC